MFDGQSEEVIVDAFFTCFSNYILPTTFAGLGSLFGTLRNLRSCFSASLGLRTWMRHCPLEFSRVSMKLGHTFPAFRRAEIQNHSIILNVHHSCSKSNRGAAERTLDFSYHEHQPAFLCSVLSLFFMVSLVFSLLSPSPAGRACLQLCKDL